MKVVAMLESSYDPERQIDGMVVVAVHGNRPRPLERFLDERLRLARQEPEKLARQIEEECLRALSELNRAPGAEHGKRTGRQAGGGTLVKGS